MDRPTSSVGLFSSRATQQAGALARDRKEDPMTEPRPEPALQEAVLALLRRYGLDPILTDHDDPVLWAVVLARHWPAPDDPDLDPSELRFGIGRLPPAGGEEAGASTRSGMEMDEVWCFERVDAGHLRAVPCNDRPQVGFMFALAMASAGDRSALDDPEVYRGRLYLDLSRPSRHAERALVHAGTSAPGNAGTGETRVWQLDESGTWVPTEEVVTRWLT
jgi:hypothetical protein